MGCNDVFIKRRSNRFLKNDLLAKEDIDAILEAGMYAPIARGKYENITINVYEGEKLESIKKAYYDELKVDIFFNCSLFIIVSQKDETLPLSNQNAGAIIENMLLEATLRDIGSVFIYSPIRIAMTKKHLMEYLNIKEGYTMLSGAVFGKKVSDNVRDIKHKIEIIK